jgi:Lon protease-like protein
MTEVPLFPLNTVTFPGLTLPLHVFEDRYRRMLTDLESQESAEQPRFAVTAIREGYEVGETGVRSLYQVGTIVQVSDVTWRGDGAADIRVTALSRVRITDTHEDHEYLTAEVEVLPDHMAGPDAMLLAELARESFAEYRAAITAVRGSDILEGELPHDPEILSYCLAATTLLPVRERQVLLEAPGPEERLGRVIDCLKAELGAMHAVPSLPATDVARTGWSPN